MAAHSVSAAGFDMNLEIMGTSRTVHITSQLPASSLQPVQPQLQADLDRHNITMRLQGPAVVPFTADLQRELVSAVLHVSLCSLQICCPAACEAEGWSHFMQ